MSLQPEFLTFSPRLGEAAPALSPERREQAAALFVMVLDRYLAKKGEEGTLESVERGHMLTVAADYSPLDVAARRQPGATFREVSWRVMRTETPGARVHELMALEHDHNPAHSSLNGSLHEGKALVRALGYRHQPGTSQVLRYETRDYYDLEEGAWRANDPMEYEPQLGGMIGLDAATHALDDLAVAQAARTNNFAVGSGEVIDVFKLLTRATVRPAVRTAG